MLAPVRTAASTVLLAVISFYAQAQPAQPPTAQKDGRESSSSHLRCVGTGEPTVIFESGAGRGRGDWEKVQPGVADLTRVCSYDRVSERDDVIDDLHSFLREASLRGPYVLVGHSLGGLYARRFASRFPDEVAGLVLVDSSDEKQLTGIIAPGLKPELYRPGAMSEPELREFFKDLGRRMRAGKQAPPGEGKKEPDDGASGEIAMARFYREIASDRRDFMFREKPLIVMTATKVQPMPRFSEEQATQLAEDHRTLQAQMLLLSSNSKQIRVADCGHYVQLDRPDVVVAAIREVVTAVRSSAKLQD